jgi:hypothetical protein
MNSSPLDVLERTEYSTRRPKLALTRRPPAGRSPGTFARVTSDINSLAISIASSAKFGARSTRGVIFRMAHFILGCGCKI